MPSEGWRFRSADDDERVIYQWQDGSSCHSTGEWVHPVHGWVDTWLFSTGKDAFVCWRRDPASGEEVPVDGAFDTLAEAMSAVEAAAAAAAQSQPPVTPDELDDLDSQRAGLAQPANAAVAVEVDGNGAAAADFAALLAECRAEEAAFVVDFGAEVSAAFPPPEIRAWQVAGIRWDDAFGAALADPGDAAAAAALTHADQVFIAARNHLVATRGWGGNG